MLRRRRPRHAPAGDCRSRQRAAADSQRERRHQDRRQRRDLQLPRAATGARRHTATASARAPPISRCSSTPTSSGAKTFLPRLRGMFALALWDGRTRTLLAARDRAGEKPLYWTLTSRGLLLASEVKALLVRPEVSRELDPVALDQFLTYEYVIAPRTILKGVHKLPAGALSCAIATAKCRCIATGTPAAVPVRALERRRGGRGAARRRCARAVSRQMMADVPLGAFLSGGIDSSTHRRVHERGVARSRSTASASASTTAPTTSCRTRARSRRSSRPTTASGRCRPILRDLFEKLVVHLDEPFADVSLFPTFIGVAAGARARQGGAVGRRRRRAVRRLRRLPGAGAGVAPAAGWVRR